MLREIAGSFDPFPEYPGSFFSYGIEVEPPSGGGQAEDAPGCVVLGEDGGLYELRIGFEADQLDTDDPATARSELRVPLDDLSPAEYVAYASRAAEAALALLERGAAERLRSSPGRYPAGRKRGSVHSSVTSSQVTSSSMSIFTPSGTSTSTRLEIMRTPSSSWTIA